MTTKAGQNAIASVDRLVALLSWRGQDGHGAVAAREGLASAQAFANDIQSVCQRATTQQLETMLQANERLSELFVQLAASKDMASLFGVQIEVVTSLTQASLASVTTWAELSQKLTDRCGDLCARATAALPAKIEPATQK